MRPSQPSTPRRSREARSGVRRRSYELVEPDGRVVDTMTYIRREFIEEFADNTNRHELGIGLIGRCLGLKRKKKISADIQQQLDLIGAKTYRQVALIDW